MSKKRFGVLIIHGITATPENVRTLAKPMESLGLNCVFPTLSGHGRESPEALRKVTRRDWLDDGERALQQVLLIAEKAIIIGHSMGGWIALNLAARHKDDINSIIVAGSGFEMGSIFAPGHALNFLVPIMYRIFNKWDVPHSSESSTNCIEAPIYRWIPAKSFYELFEFAKETIRCLPDVQVPILILHSKKDMTNLPEGVKVLFESISTPENQKQMKWFEKTGHQMFLDCEREEVIDTVTQYVKERIKLPNQ